MFSLLLLIPISLDPIQFTECEKCDQVISHCINEQYKLSNDLYYMQDDPDLEKECEIMKAKCKVYEEIIDLIVE
jgi:hypothetical protein